MNGCTFCALGSCPKRTEKKVLTSVLRAFRSALLVFWVAGGCWLAVPSACAESPKPAHADGELQFLRQDGSTVVSISIEIADTPEARIRGLMERWSLPDLNGMLFIFDSPEEQRFWMHNTPLSLDMIFVDENRRIVNIAESTRPMSKQTYASRGPAKYVVEVKAGFSKQHGITEGMRIQWKVRPKPQK